MPGWRNGRRDGLKIHCPLKTCGFEPRPGHSRSFKLTLEASLVFRGLCPLTRSLHYHSVRYPRGSRATDIALTRSVPLSAGRVETRQITTIGPHASLNVRTLISGGSALLAFKLIKQK